MNTAAPRLKRLLVTGASGFVLRQAVPIWQALGYDVIAVDQRIDRPILERWQVMKRSISLLEAPLEQALAEDLLPPCDALIHGAAITADPESAGLTPAAHLNANLQPALMLLDWAAKQGIGRVICLSSSAVYAATEGTVSEDQPTMPRGTYAIAKATIEALTATLKTLYQRDVLSIRLGNIYGIGEAPSTTRPRISLIGQMIHEALASAAITVPSSDQSDPQTREWTFAPDIAYAIHALLETPMLPHALYQVAAGEQADRLTIAQALQAVLPDVKLQTRPADPLPALARRGMLSHARLEADTGFARWTPLQTGIRRVVEAELAFRRGTPLTY